MNALYRKNENETNLIVINAFLIIYGFIILMAVFCWFGIFDVSLKLIIEMAIWAFVPLIVPAIIVHAFHIDKPWLKYVLIMSIGFATGICYTIFTFQTVILFLLPSIIACFYLNRKVFLFSETITSLAIIVSHVMTGFYLYQPWLEPFSDMKSIMVYGALPRLLQYLLCFALLYMLTQRHKAFMEEFYQTIQEERIHQKENDLYEDEFLKVMEVLTEREKDVFELIVRGYTNTQIADKLCLSLGTVKNYVSLIYDKIGSKERNKIILKFGRFYQGND